MTQEEEVAEARLLTSQAASLDGISPDGISPDGINSDVIKVAGKPEPRNSLSLCSKLCYAIGGAPYQITATALGFFLQIYLLDVAELNPLHVSIIVFAGRACDAITDPIVGFLVSRSPWTRLGRMLTWIVLSTPVAVLAYFLVWFVPPFADGKIFYYMVFYCLFETMQTCFHVPYTSLTMFLTTEQKERDSCSAYRMTVEVLGMLIGTAVTGQIVGMASAPCIPTSMDATAVLNDTSMFAVNATVPALAGQASLQATRFAYMMASLAVGGIYIFCAVVLFAGVKERKEAQKKSEKVSFFQAIRMVMGYGPYAILNLGCLFTATGFYLLEGNFAVFCTYSLNHRNEFQNILLVSMISATVSVPFWHWFQTKFGKKTAFYVGNLVAVPFLILAVSLKSNLILTYIIAFAVGMSIGSAVVLLPWSMLPDVIDDFKAHNPESVGHETIFYSFYVFSSKFASGLSLGISTLSLHLSGYVTRGCSQPPKVLLTLNLLVSAIPILFIMVGLAIFYFYPINEETRKGNSKLLREQRNSKPVLKWTQDIQEDSTELSNMV